MARNRNSRVAHTRDLVAQGSWADTEFFSRELTAAATFFQSAEYEPPFMILEVGTQCLSVIIIEARAACIAIYGRQRHVFEDQITLFNRVTVAQDKRTLQYVVEFAHVPRPTIFKQPCARAGAEFHRRDLALCGNPPQQRRGQRYDIRLPFA